MADQQATREQGGLRLGLDQLYVLTSSDLRARYGRGGWQLVKWLIDPFALVGVYLLMVRFIFYRQTSDVGLSLACAIIPFQLLSMTVSSSLDAVRLRRAIISNMPLPRVLLPISTTFTEVIGFGASLVLLVLMMAIYAVAPSVSILWLPVALVETIVLGVALSYAASLIGLWASATKGLIMSAVRSAYFLAPGLVTLASIHGTTNTLVRFNPFTALFELFRHAVLYRSAPPAWEVLYPLLAATVLLSLAVPIYVREQSHFAKVLE